MSMDNIQKAIDSGQIWLEPAFTVLQVLTLVRLGHLRLTTWPDLVMYFKQRSLMIQ